MRSFVQRRLFIGAAVVIAAAAVTASMMMAQEAAPSGAQSLSKPLGQLKLGDVFPKVVTEQFAETGKNWGKAADELIKVADARKASVSSAITVKKQEMPATKDKLAEAKKQKDLVQVGTLEGTLKNEELTLRILDGLNRFTDEQVALAKAFKNAGQAMERFTTADAAFDTHRAKMLTRPEAGQPDQRLDPAGYTAFKAHAEALDELGKAYTALGAQAEKMAATRLKILTTLEKGGHVQAPK